MQFFDRDFYLHFFNYFISLSSIDSNQLSRQLSMEKQQNSSHYQMNSQLYRERTIEEKFHTEAAEELLDKSTPKQENRYSTFEIDGSQQDKQKMKRFKAQDLGHQKDLSTKQYCYPAFLTWLGSCITPCLVVCPCIRCENCCYNRPLFEQPVQNVGLLQRWGSFQRILSPGLHVINPISEKVIEINQQTRTLQFSQIVFTRDNVQFRVDSVVFYRVINTFDLAFKLGSTQAECKQCIGEIAQACLRNIVGVNTLQQVIEGRQTLSQQLKMDLNSNLSIWGIYVQRCSLKQLRLSEQIKLYLETTAKTKRTMEAQIINYKAEVQVGKLLKEVAEHLSTKAAFQIRYLDAVGEIISKNSNSIMMVKMQTGEI